MASLNKQFLVIASLALCHVTRSTDPAVLLNSTDGMIYMDSFVAHEVFYSSLQEVMRNKVKSAIENILAHSKVDITQLLPNIDATEYTILQILHSLAHDDLSFVNLLVESLNQRSVDGYLVPRSQGGAISEFLKSNIALTPSEMYKVAKTLMDVERDGFKTIPKSIVEAILSIMNKPEIFVEASRRGDIDVMKWLLLSENNLDLSTALDTACTQTRLDIVSLLIENDPSNRLEIINVTNCNKETLLHAAVLARSQRVLSLLISAGVSVDVLDSKGVSPLYLAVKHNSLLMSKLLIDGGANVNQETVEGDTALHEALRNGMVDLAELLIDSGSIGMQKNKYGISPVMLSEKYVITNTVQYLINNKVNLTEDDLLCHFNFMVPDRREEEGSIRDEENIDLDLILRHSELVNQMKSKVLWDSCKEQSIKAKLLNITMINSIAPLVQSMINLGVRLDVESDATKNAFLNYIEKGNTEMTIPLLNKGVSVNTTIGGRSALHVAAMNGHTKIFYLLVERGANIHAPRFKGRTVLHYAIEGHENAIVEYLIKRGLDVNPKAGDSESPLTLAAFSGNYIIIKTLIKYGADVGLMNGMPLLIAIFSSNVNSIKAVNVLLDNGADVEAKGSYGVTSLIAAVFTGNEDKVEALLNRGASVDATDDARGNTALHLAAKKGYLKIAEILLKHGHKIDIKNNDGKTPLDEAIEGRHSSIINLLIRE
ncbi:putative ankyrin repeat protein RF_0381 [Halyomorpha halys]|uniref:putative ankyrin repeat protein RF_0381 n=1 Tax=Halyomorpha halys TaxID=286706 RepID=UPI0006D4E8B5|nr:uncharacterized protein LOC106682264 [Halyomorpha halys]XP_014278503.1 uncharacterized protein LOC106682264 [Halyomorpha halys]